MPCILFHLLIFLAATSSAVSQFQGPIGVCNGRVGNNLPSEQDVVELYKANGIKKMRIYDPNQATLSALQGSDIELILDVPNADLQSLQSDASEWVRSNVAPHFPATKIRYIAVGNEVNSAALFPLLLPAMQNIHRALTDLGFEDQIKVSTATYSAVLKDTYPPSTSAFNDQSIMAPIVDFLVKTQSPLLFNIYPYFAYVGDKNINLDFALFTSDRVQLSDNGFDYRNLFDAMVDGVYYALEKVGGSTVEVVVSETGWPSGGGDGDGAVETLEMANSYYRNLIRHVSNGTPKRPGKALETYLFAMFDENEKPGAPTERHFGLFNPVEKTPKYQLA